MILESEKARKGRLRRNATYRNAHREEIRVRERECYQGQTKKAKTAGEKYRKKLKEQIIKHYSNGTIKCVRCGVDDIDMLCLDHINGNGNGHRRSIGITSGYAFYRWIISENFPLGFQTLCYNCNMKKRITEDKY